MNSHRPVFRKELIRLPDGIPGGVVKYRTLMSIDMVELANDTVGQWEAFYKPPELQTVSIAAFTAKKEMILVHLFRFPTERWSIELPGGDANREEDLVAAARRELLEETGYSTAEPLILISDSDVSAANMNVGDVTFCALNCTQTAEVSLDPMEQAAGLEIILIDPKQIAKDVVSLDKRYNRAITHALFVLSARGIS